MVMELVHWVYHITYVQREVQNMYNYLLAGRIIQNYTSAVEIFQNDTRLNLEYSENISS
jgi:uncharacterized protein YqgQ